MKIISNSASPTKIILGARAVDEKPQLYISTNLRSVNGEPPITKIVDDRVEIQHVSAIVYRDFNFDVGEAFDGETYTIVSGANAVKNMSTEGLLETRDIDQDIVVRVEWDNWAWERIVNPLVSTSQTATEWQSWVPGSVSQAITTTVDSLITDHPAATGRDMYAPYSPTAPQHNPQSIIADYNQKTAISFHNDQGGRKRSGSAITPRHVWLANHYPVNVGRKIRFLTADNTVVTRTVERLQQITSDAMLGLLDSDLPAGIEPMRVLPDNWPAFAPTLTSPPNRGAVPAFYSGQDKQTEVRNYHGIRLDDNAYMSASPADAGRQSYYQTPRSGDSGSPNFFPLDGELVLFGVHYTAGHGICVAATELDTAITSIDTAHGINTGYTVTPADFSGYEAQ